MSASSSGVARVSEVAVPSSAPRPRASVPPSAATRGAEAAAPSVVQPVVKASSSRKKWILSVLVIAAIGGGGAYYAMQRGLESTDDAQVDADIIAVPARLGGSIASVSFEENQRVEAGALLAQLDDAPARAKLAQADANLAAAEAAAHAADTSTQLSGSDARSNFALAAAGVRNSAASQDGVDQQIAQSQAMLDNARARASEAQQNLDRARNLFEHGATSQAELDRLQSAQQVAQTEIARAGAALDAGNSARAQARSKVDEARAKLSQSDQVTALIEAARARAEQAHAAVAVAQAARDLAALDLSYTQIKAPTAGVVSKKTVEPGQAVAVGQTVVQLVSDTRWVTANFKETQVGGMQVGQPVEFEVDAYPGKKFQGEVMSFSAATGARFALLPPDNATGNYTKVVQRVPVRVRVTHLPSGIDLRPGMSVQLEVDTLSAGHVAEPTATASVTAVAPSSEK